MPSLIYKILESPIQSLGFLYAFTAQTLLVLLRRILLPQFPVYQSLRTQIQRAYLSSAAIHYPDIVHRLPVSCPESIARKLSQDSWIGYVVPGTVNLDSLAYIPNGSRKIIALYAHGGGYARGEARMYLPYMQRWIEAAVSHGLELCFLTVEYPLSTQETNPAQRDCFIEAFKYLLRKGIPPHNIIFMGDSAGGGICVNSSLEALRKELPQPAGSVLISPWLDMSLKAYEGGNMAVESDFFVVANSAVPRLTGMFLGSNYTGVDPAANPLCREVADIEGLNSQLIIVGAAEFALQDSKEWAALCKKAKVTNELIIGHGELHVWALGSSFIDPILRVKTDEKIISWMIDCSALNSS